MVDQVHISDISMVAAKDSGTCPPQSPLADGAGASSKREVDLHAVAKGFGLAYRFSKKQTLANSRISSFLGSDVSEQDDRPVYYALDRVRFRGQEWFSITFSLFFLNNPGYSIFGYTVGEHAVDVECITVLFDLGCIEPSWVYFRAHGKGQGVWREWKDCERNTMRCDGEEREVLNVYVSPMSHGMYPEGRNYPRLFGLANDVCDGDGELWIPGEACRCDARKQSWSESHYQVKRGINTPANISPPLDRSISDVERFCLVLPAIAKRVREGECVEIIERL